MVTVKGKPMMYKALVFASGFALSACAMSQAPVVPNVQASSSEFRLGTVTGKPGEQTGEWLKAVCRAQSKMDETCVSYMWGVLDALAKWPPSGSGRKPICISGQSYGSIADRVRSYLSRISDEVASRTDAASLVEIAATEEFPC